MPYCEFTDMDAPKYLKVVSQHGQFDCRTKSFDVFDCPYNCRGITAKGYRCSRNIARSHVPNLPYFTLKGLAAFWNEPGCGNQLAAYYCWQHTSQASFRPSKSASMSERDALGAAEITSRRPLGEKSTNINMNSNRRVKEEVKVEEVDEVVWGCRAARPQKRPTVITATALVRSPEISCASPVKSPKLRVHRDTSEEEKPTTTKEKTKAPSAPSTSKAEAEAAELKATNAHLLAALQQLVNQLEGLTAKVESLEKKEVEEKTPATRDFGTSTDEHKEQQTQGATASKHQVGSGTITERYKPEGGMDINKRPVMSVEAVDLESGLPDNTRTQGRWDSLKGACCKCM